MKFLVKMQACGICGSDVEKVFGKYGATIYEAWA